MGPLRHIISCRSMEHVYHWSSVHDDIETRVMDLIEDLCKNGEIQDTGYRDRKNTRFHYVISDQGPLGIMGVARDKDGTGADFLFSFPLMYMGQENELEVYDAGEIPDGDEDPDFTTAEGSITCITRDGTEITLYCPIWLLCRDRMEKGGRYMFEISGLAYLLDKAPTEFKLSEGGFFEDAKRRWIEEHPAGDPASFTSVTVQTGNLRMFFSRDVDGIKAGDIEFQSVVEEAIPFESLGISGYILKLCLTPEGRQPVRVSMFATSTVLKGYVPVPGDPVRGVAWLQGIPHAEQEGASWLDSEEAAHGGNDGLFAMVSYLGDNPHLPLGNRLVGAALVRAGWDIVMTEERLFIHGRPAFIAERGERRCCFFVSTAIEGFSAAESFGDLPERQSEMIASRGMTGYHVTITLTPSGKNYRVSAEGFGDLSDDLQVAMEVAKPEEDRPVVLGGPQAPDPVLDEREAVTRFIRAFEVLELDELSRLLVEDLVYHSEITATSISGRQAFLSYLGGRFESWLDARAAGEDSAKGPKAMLRGMAVENGRKRPCAIALNAEGSPFSYTLFTGRKGHIAVIETRFFDSMRVGIID